MMDDGACGMRDAGAWCMVLVLRSLMTDDDDSSCTTYEKAENCCKECVELRILCIKHVLPSAA